MFYLASLCLTRGLVTAVGGIKAIPVRRYCPGSSPDKGSDYVAPAQSPSSISTAVTFVRFGSWKLRFHLSPFLEDAAPTGLIGFLSSAWCSPPLGAHKRWVQSQ